MRSAHSVSDRNAPGGCREKPVAGASGRFKSMIHIGIL